ncbi:hypothetical protein [Vibrio crassostreae]|uniref:hypothetical protein n=1 Tax=Vibrio crassostreae TaxID=246167 RepID=UPI00352D4C26
METLADVLYRQMTSWSATYYKEFLKQDISTFFPQSSKIFTKNLLKDIHSTVEPMQLVIIGHLYFDYFLLRALEESGINSNDRRYQSFKAKLNKSQELELLTQLQYEFLDEINKLRNRFAHDVFFDITSWDPTTLPLVRNYSLVVPKRKDLLVSFIVTHIRFGFFLTCMEAGGKNEWLALENVPKHYN